MAKVNVNTATQDELLQVEGIGPAAVRAILRYREKGMHFTCVEELARLPGIHDARLDHLRARFTVQERH